MQILVQNISTQERKGAKEKEGERKDEWRRGEGRWEAGGRRRQQVGLSEGTLDTCVSECVCVQGTESCKPTDKKRSGGSEVGRWEETGRRVDDHTGGKSGRDERTAPPFSALQRWLRPPELRSWLRQRTWQPPNLCRMKTDFPRQPCTLGPGEGTSASDNSNEPQPVVPASQAERGRDEGGRGEASLRFRSGGYYQHLLVEPGYSVHPCRHRMGTELVGVP